MATERFSGQPSRFHKQLEVDVTEQDSGMDAPRPVSPLCRNHLPSTPKSSSKGHQHHDRCIVRSPVSVRESLTVPVSPGTPQVETQDLSLDAYQRKNSRKRVHYCWAPPSVDVQVAPGPTEEEKNLLWYSRRELREFKRQAKRQCKQAWRDNARDLDLFYCGSEVQQQEQDKQQAEQTSSAPFSDVHHASGDLAQNELFTTYRGLEHLTSQKLCLVRSMTVLAAKTELMLGQMAGNSGGDKDEEEAQRLANIYAKASRPAVRFARVVALADAIVAGHAPVEEPAHQS